MTRRLVLVALLVASPAAADEIRCAVASNFAAKRFGMSVRFVF